ncbi:MAG: hypothetical protein EP335_17705 [Alphaproteobacteria bacterium]|nr:MAG: hypothetical protein EP335_17705 [Alphaproteobacteria bacterium]
MTASNECIVGTRRCHRLKALLAAGAALWGAQAATAQDSAAGDAADTPVGQRAVHVLATDWGMTLKSDGTGFYNDLARFVIQKADMGANYEVQPYRRAKARFFREPASCLYPSNLNVLSDGQEIETREGLIESDAIIRVRVFMFSPPGTTPPAKMEDINDRIVAYALGSSLPQFLKGTHADFIAVTDEVAKAQMLLSGRVDLMSAAMPDLKFVMDKLGTHVPPFNPDFPLNDTYIGVVCHDTPANRAFIGRLNDVIGATSQDGSLAAFLTGQDLDASVYLPRAISARN